MKRWRRHGVFTVDRGVLVDVGPRRVGEGVFDEVTLTHRDGSTERVRVLSTSASNAAAQGGGVSSTLPDGSLYDD